MLVFSLGAVFMAAPVAAADDYWSAFSIPVADGDGDWFMDDAITTVGPIARGIDGHFWAYVEQGDGEDEIYRSLDTEGRTWEKTYYSDTTYGVAGLDVLDIVCSTVDADVVYVADVAEVYKTEDGGATFTEVGNFDGDVAKTISCLAVGWDDDDDPRVYVGLADSEPLLDNALEVVIDETEGIYYFHDTPFGQTWTDLQLDATDTGRDDSTVWGINVSPDFANDAFVAALITNYEDSQTQLVWNVGATVGSWAYTTLDDADGADAEATDGSAPQFPDDFDGDDFLDEDGEIFVAAAGDWGAATTHALGGVWRVYGTDDGDEEQLDASTTASADVLDVDFCSLATAGDEGNVQLLAGEDGDNDVWYSWDDGDNWAQASAEGISPVGGAADTFVLMDADFDEDAGIGWAATDGDECGLHITVDGGTSWQGISLLDTEINNIVTAAVVGTAPDTIYLLTDDAGGAKEMFRYSADSAAWERIYEEGLMTVALGDMTIIGVYESTVVLADSGTDDLIFSEDGGQIFADTDREPGTAIISLLLVDEDTWWVGDTAGDLVVTDNAGNKAWNAAIEIDSGGDDITSLAVRGDEALAGNADSEVFYSDDEGLTWSAVGNTTSDLEAKSTTGAGNTYVCFDSGNDNDDVIYATTDDVVGRFQYLTTDLSEDWELFADAGALVAATGPIGIACSEGVVYVGSNSDAVAAHTAGGVLRIVEPIYSLDDVSLSTVDTVIDAELSAGDGFQGGMLVTSSDGLNVLWGIDQDAGATETQLWTYNDLLVGPPTGGFATADDVSAVLEWDGLGNAADYELEVYSSEAMLSLATRWYSGDISDDEPIFGLNDSTTDAPHATDDLASGTQYWWCVRVQNSDYNTGTVTSKYSAVWTFTTKPGGLDVDEDRLGPAVGAINVPIDTPFTWAFLEEADSYVIDITDTADFSNIIQSATVTLPTYQSSTTLDYFSSYYWRVWAVSGTTAGNPAYGNFTTEKAPVVAPTPPAAAPSDITIPPVQQITPNWIYAIIAIGATLATVVIVLIVKTRRPS